MKKSLFILILVLGLASPTFADEIFNADGKTIQCKVITVADGLIEYDRYGSVNSFTRVTPKTVFNDYVDVRTTLWHPTETERIFGHVIYRDGFITRVITKDGDIVIPFYRNHFMGIYKFD